MSTLEEQARHATVLDDRTRRVARIYAEALLRAAETDNQTGEVLEELEGLVGQVFSRDPALETFLDSAAVGRDAKARALHQAFQGRASDVLTRFLYILNDHDRLDVLRAVALSYRELFDSKANRVRVRVDSAVPLAEDQQERLRQELRTATGKDPILETHLDPDLLGGIVVRLADWVYDASVRTRIDDIRKQLIERSSHEIKSGRDRFGSA